MKKIVILGALAGLSACSLNTIALHSTADIIAGGSSAIYEEPDPQLAQDALPAQLKLAEILLRNDPNNPKLLNLAAEGFNGYAFLFIEDDSPERAKGLYARGRDYALKLLALKPAFANLTEKSSEDITETLKQADKSDVPALFWAAFGWANWINLSKDSPQALLELPKAVALMRRVSELSPEFYFGGPEIFFGSYYASRPAILGGDAHKAKDYFEQARKLTAGKYLMAYVQEARYYAVAVQDKELFTNLLQKVADEPAGALPGAMLADQVAKIKAAKLLKERDDYF